MCLITEHIQMYLFHTTHQIFNCSLEKAHVIWSTISTASTSSTTATATSHTSCGSSGCVSIWVKPLFVSTGHLPIWVRPLITCGLIRIGTIKLKKKSKSKLQSQKSDKQTTLIKHYSHENKGNYYELKEFLIVRQILLVSITRNV